MKQHCSSQSVTQIADRWVVRVHDDPATLDMCAAICGNSSPS
jgi:hypothetical protein